MKLDNLLTELKNLQNSTIGLFKPHVSSKIELVVANENGVLKTLSIGTLGGLTTSYTDQTQGRLVMFLDDATLTDMLRDNPSGLNMLCASFKQ